MTHVLFVVGLGLGLASLFAWCFRHLPEERWQFVASRPTRSLGAGRFEGVNFTFYGLFSATAQASAVALFVVLAGSVGVAAPRALAFVLTITGCGVVAATVLLRLVEGKRHGFTVGGAVFAAVLAAWPVARLTDALLPGSERLPLLPLIAALGVAYALGESLGRLACISFGCCYGKPVAEAREPWRWLSRRRPFVFTGGTRKAVFAGGLDGVPVVPIQAITCVVLASLALAGAALFLGGSFGPALVVSLAGSQVWRAVSETARADWRGGLRFTWYQRFALGVAGIATVWAFALPGQVAPPSLVAGLEAVWQPLPLLSVQAVWALAFWRMGRSTQTRSAVEFGVNPGRI